MFIAARAVTRVAPHHWSNYYRYAPPNQNDDQKIWRIMPISRVTRTRSHRDIGTTGAFTAHSNLPVGFSDAALDAFDASNSACLAATDANVSSSAAYMATLAADTSAMWNCIRSDAQYLNRGGRPDAYQPLWCAEVPDWSTELWTEVKTALRATPNPEDWDFWIDWYEAELAGRPMLPRSEDHWDLLADIFEVKTDPETGEKLSLLDESDWEKGSAHVNPIIRQHYEKAKARFNGSHADVAGAPSDSAPITDELLDAVFRATPNSERIEFDPEQGLIRAVPESGLPQDYLHDTLDRLQDAADTFGPPDRFGNQYAALVPDIETLAKALGKYADRPLRLHDVADDLLARLDTRIANGECPDTASDALIGSYKSNLAGAIGDLRAHDPRVQEAVQARTAHISEPIAEGDIKYLADGVAEAACLTDETLRLELREDIATLLANHHAAPAECRHALLRLCSRLPRILWVYRSEATQGFLLVTGVGQGLEWSFKAICKILGLGGGSQG